MLNGAVRYKTAGFVDIPVKQMYLILSNTKILLLDGSKSMI
jgi:hypothetical protein